MATIQCKPIPKKILDIALEKSIKQAYYLKGERYISPRKMKKIISFIRIPKEKIYRVDKTNQNKVMIDLQHNGLIKYVAAHIVKFNDSKLLEIQKNKSSEVFGKP